jgi:hypothetical protein
MSDDVVITIDHNIPMPDKAPSKSKYPWLEMGIGDSFLFPASSKRNGYTSARQASERTGRTFVTRTTRDGLRCWRIA